jgi:hypothetical protein
MGKTLIKTNIKRESTKLYYCGTSAEGFITVCEAEMKRNKKKKGVK